MAKTPNRRKGTALTAPRPATTSTTPETGASPAFAITPERLKEVFKAALSRWTFQIKSEDGRFPTEVQPDNVNFDFACRDLAECGGITIDGVPITIDGDPYDVQLIFVHDGKVCLGHVLGFSDSEYEYDPVKEKGRSRSCCRHRNLRR